MKQLIKCIAYIILFVCVSCSGSESPDSPTTSKGQEDLIKEMFLGSNNDTIFSKYYSLKENASPWNPTAEYIYKINGYRIYYFLPCWQYSNTEDKTIVIPPFKISPAETRILITNNVIKFFDYPVSEDFKKEIYEKCWLEINSIQWQEDGVWHNFTPIYPDNLIADWFCADVEIPGVLELRQYDQFKYSLTLFENNTNSDREFRFYISGKGPEAMVNSGPPMNKDFYPEEIWTFKQLKK